jgi:hypothetical protein
MINDRPITLYGGPGDGAELEIPYNQISYRFDQLHENEITSTTYRITSLKSRKGNTVFSCYDKVPI